MTDHTTRDNLGRNPFRKEPTSSDRSADDLATRMDRYRRDKYPSDLLKKNPRLLDQLTFSEPGSLQKDEQPNPSGKTRPLSSLFSVHNGSNFKDSTSPQEADPELQDFLNSLTPAQKDIQRKIAALGGSQKIGEIPEILPEKLDGYFRTNKGQANIYDGGFPLGKSNHINSRYTPSDDVHILKDQFDQSLTPEQKMLRSRYEDKIDQSIRSGNILFRQNADDIAPLINVSPKDLGFETQYDRNDSLDQTNGGRKPTTFIPPVNIFKP